MTSNLGSGVIKEKSGKSEKELKEDLDRLLNQTFRPEFLNRVDSVVTYKPLTAKIMDRIVEIQIENVRERLSEQEVILEVSDKAKKYLAEKGYDPVFGARPLSRLINDEILDEIAFRIIEGKLQSGDKITVNVDPKRKLVIGTRLVN